MPRRFAVSIVAGLAVLAAGLPASASAPLVTPDARSGASEPGAFTAAGSVGQVYVTDARPAQVLVLRDASGRRVGRATVNDQGGALFRDVAPGDGYRVRGGGDPPDRSSPLRVATDAETPPESFYAAQVVGDGYGYVTTRDGTRLAVNVHLPGPPEDGPYPTVVEYSGYAAADPEGIEPATLFARQLGYATVGVNLRGTGCSGGAWSYFEPLQSLDGYDVIETIAAQPWVLHGAVGMVGISYSGIAQLFVAATRPPHLAAITPLSVIDDTYRGVLYPGGILNSGYAVPWAEDRADDAMPAPDGGQEWATDRIEDGDDVCRANQALHAEADDVLARVRPRGYADVPWLEQADPSRFVHRIEVPTFIAGSWQDEETGGRWPALLEHFTPGLTLRATLTNGTHAEPFLPSIITRWAEFLDVYVARRVPSIPAGARVGAALAFNQLGFGSVVLPPDRFAGETDYAAVRARYEAEPPVRVLFDNGAGGAPEAPVPGFEAEFADWPVPGVVPTAWYFGADGTLRPEPGDTAGVDRFRYAPASVPATTAPLDEDEERAEPRYRWKPLPDGRSLAYVSEPLTEDVVVLGPGSVDLWLRSSARDVDLEVTLSEVRPDGKETYVQSGWLRAGHRRLDPESSTELEPVPTHARADAAPLPAGRFTPVRVAIFPVGHVFRIGSRLRISVQAPGGNRPLWAFEAQPARGTVTNEIAFSGERPSRVVLAVVPAVAVPTPLPACPALRGQPCRPYVEP